MDVNSRQKYFLLETLQVMPQESSEETVPHPPTAEESTKSDKPDVRGKVHIIRDYDAEHGTLHREGSVICYSDLFKREDIPR